MKRIIIITVVAVFMLPGNLVAVDVEPAEQVSEALLPSGKAAVRQVHELHGKNSPSCNKCHPKVARSRWASERLVPRMEDCVDCHPAADNVTLHTPVTDECRTCHGKLKKDERPIRGDYPRPNIRFSHKAHQGGHASCTECHPRAAAGLPRGESRDLMGMRKCYFCHIRGKGSTECRTCHLVHRDGKLVTKYKTARLTPPTWLVGPNHGVEWAGQHARTAGADSSMCANCHREKFCSDCHSGKLRPRNIHPGDWITAHGVSTRLNNPRCRGCHRKQSFCLGCHRRSGVASDSPKHARPEGGAGRYHKGMENRTLMRRAKHDITTCVSCHSEGSCITCHQRQKPHPPGWSRKCAKVAARNPNACAKCHSGGAWSRCN
jgi:hypothetical protein